MAEFNGQKLKEFFTLDEASVGRMFDPSLYSYHKKLFSSPSEADGFLHYCSSLISSVDFQDGELLDSGCGFGVVSYGFAAAPGPGCRITGLDPSEKKIEVMEKVGGYLGVGPDEVTPVFGDALAMDFDDASFDVVFAKDVASHIRDRELFFTEILRVLKPGGRLLLTDENNALDIFGWGPRKKLWRQNEEGPIQENSWMLRTYREERRLMIDEWRPDLPEITREKLAMLSMGMWGDGLKEAIEGYTEGEEFLATADFPYRHPASGEYMEFPFNPFDLCETLIAHEFSTARTIRPVFPTGNPVKRFAGNIIRMMHPLSIYFQPNLYIIATK